MSRMAPLLVGLVLVWLSACGGDGASDRRSPAEDASAANGGGSGAGNGLLPDGGLAGDAASQMSPMGAVQIEPMDAVVNVVDGKAETIAFSAKVAGVVVSPVWSVSRAEIGTIDAGSGVFETGLIGGEALITADIGSTKASTKITVIVLTTQNGTKGGSTCAAGGCGGVGGEGTGPAVTSAQRKALDEKATADTAFTWLYPYDGTVWPLDLLAPLLQWGFGATAADAVKIELRSPFYSYKGYFARPAALDAAAAFVRHPIPQGVWRAATHSSAGGRLNVKLTALAGGKAIGPISQTWTVANGALKGTVYYQSYGTNLAKNLDGAMGGDGRFGGATLAIQGGSTAPTLVAGSDGGEAECRVCHTMSADGSRMIVQHGTNYTASSSYALTQAGFPETPYTQLGLMAWSALYPDGSMAVTNGAPLAGGANTVDTALVDAETGVAIPSASLSAFVTKAGMPTFSPDGKKVAFVHYAGPGDATIGAGDESKLVVMSFDRKSHAFSNPKLVYQGSGGNRPGWPAFMPGSDALVFQLDLPSGANRGEYFATRGGARGALWYVDLKTQKALALDGANGPAYLPIGANNHAVDHEQAFEPTVNPIVSGGYAWVVFTSRRMYGNVATVDPTWSDPRYHDISVTPTTKKLWVAAIELPASGEIQAEDIGDPSHPAFYLPAQELLAGNSRGYWVPEPCRADGKGCETGDQCCAGFCAYDAKKDKAVCGGEPPTCAAEFDRCDTAADCCPAADGSMLSCINKRCAVQVLAPE